MKKERPPKHRHGFYPQHTYRQLDIPLPTQNRASMQPQSGNRNDEHHHEDERARSSPHIPLGSHDIPLLELEHAPLNFARRHNVDVPRHDAPGYAHYQALQKVAFANAVRELEKELGSRSHVDHLELENTRLIVRHYSQSKLSQQELADLQKATHFDKKELQQWYKGAHRLGTYTLDRR